MSWLSKVISGEPYSERELTKHVRTLNGLQGAVRIARQTEQVYGTNPHRRAETERAKTSLSRCLSKNL
jgi:hypothetical protein